MSLIKLKSLDMCIKGGTQQISKQLIELVLDNNNRVEDRLNKLLLNTALVQIIQNGNNENELVQVMTSNTVSGEKRTFRAKKVFNCILFVLKQGSVLSVSYFNFIK